MVPVTGRGGRTQTIHGWYGLAARLVNPDNNRLLEGLIAGPLSLLDPASSTFRCCAAATWSSEVGRQPTERQGETRGGVTVLTCVFTYIYHGVENEYILRWDEELIFWWFLTFLCGCTCVEFKDVLSVTLLEDVCTNLCICEHGINNFGWVVIFSPGIGSDYCIFPLEDFPRNALFVESCWTG